MPIYQMVIVMGLILAFLGVIGHVIRCYYFDKPKKPKEDIYFKIHKVDVDEPHWDCGNN